MVSKWKFSKIKRENPESRIWQRTWEQEKYRNNLYKTLKKGLKSSDADAIVTKNNFDNEKKTWKYISAEYGTTKKWAIQMIKDWYLELVADNFDEFYGLDKEFAMFVLTSYKGSGYTVYGRNRQKWIDWSNAIRKLCESIVKNADKISWLDKEFFDLYLDFNIKLYDDVPTEYAWRYATKTKWNPTDPLLDNIKFIEWVDEKLLLSYCLNSIKSYQSEFGGHKFNEGEPEYDRELDSHYHVRAICASLVKKATIKIPRMVWDRVRVFDCFNESDLDFTTFYDRLEWFNFSDYFKTHNANALMTRVLSIDDFEKLLIKESWTKGIWRYLKIPSYWTPGWEKRYRLVIKHLNCKETLLCFWTNDIFEENLHSLLCWLSDYLSKNLEILKSWGGFDTLIDEIHYKFWSKYCSYNWNYKQYGELHTLRVAWEWCMKSDEKIKKQEDIKRREEEEKLKKQEIKESIKKDYSHWIALFLWGWEYSDYVKELLLKTKVNWLVSKSDFTKLYWELTPEEQKRLLKLFKTVELK